MTGRDRIAASSGVMLAAFIVVAWVTRAEPTPGFVNSNPARTAPDAHGATSAGSIYDLGIEVIGSDGARHGLDELRGHPVLASMFYSTCPTVCPTLITDMRRVEAALPARARDEARLVLVSFDPERDQPAVLRDVLARHRLDSGRWLVAAARNEDAARTLAAALGIRYRAGAGGSFEHTTRIVLLDRTGQVRAAADDTANAAAALGPIIGSL